MTFRAHTVTHVDILWPTGGRAVRNRAVFHLGRNSQDCRGNTTPHDPHHVDSLVPRMSTRARAHGLGLSRFSTGKPAPYYGYALDTF